MKTSTQTFVKVKEKYRITLPPTLRKKMGLAVGDILESKVEGRKITFSPKSILDRELEASLEDVRRGRVYGPFKTVKEMLQALHCKKGSKMRK